MRFLVDECTGPAVARWLRNQQHEVFSVYEEARGTEDDVIIQKAFEENWILITNDKDFGEKVYRERYLPGLASEGFKHGVLFYLVSGIFLRYDGNIVKRLNVFRRDWIPFLACCNTPLLGCPFHVSRPKTDSRNQHIEMGLSYTCR